MADPMQARTRTRQSSRLSGRQTMSIEQLGKLPGGRPQPKDRKRPKWRLAKIWTQTERRRLLRLVRARAKSKLDSLVEFGFRDYSGKGTQ